MELKNSNSTNLLAIAAHHDDIEVMAMDGILKAYGSKKYDFYACVLGDGANCIKSGKYADVSDKEMMEARNQEQTRASQIGEYEKLVMLKHSQEELENDEKGKIGKELRELILDVKPDIIYTHNIFDKNPAHRITCKRVIDAILSLDEDDRPRLVYGCELFRSLDWLPDKYKVVFDLSENKELQSRLIGVYDTKIEQFKNYNKAIVGRKMAHAAFGSSVGDGDEDKLIWYGINLTPVVAKNIDLKDYCTRILSDFNKEMLDLD